MAAHVAFFATTCAILCAVLPSLEAAAFFYGATETKEEPSPKANEMTDDADFDLDELRVTYQFCTHMPLMVKQRLAKPDVRTQELCQHLLRYLRPLFQQRTSSD